MVPPTFSDMLKHNPVGTPAPVILSREQQDLIAENKALRARICELEHAADTDPLVPVYNRRVRDCDLVARLGGDEFGVLLFKTDASIAKAKASALACRISELTIPMPTGSVITTGASWGVAACEAEDTADQILSRADRAMYIAKRRKAA